MATGGGFKEFGVRLKVGVEGQDNAERLGKALRDLGVNTDELDQAADRLGAGLQGATKGADSLAGSGKGLAEAQSKVAKETTLAGAAVGDNAKGVDALATKSKTTTEILSGMKLELAAAGAAVYTAQRLLGDAATAAAAFGKNMAEVSTLLDNDSGMERLTEDVRALAREYGGNAPEQAKALYQIISAGTSDAAKATELLAAANKLAIGGVTEVGIAADGLTSAMNAYGKEAGTAEQVSDMLFVAMRAGKTTVGELANSIGQTAPIASTAGVKLNELLSAVSALTKGGVGTGEAMTQVRSAISSIIKPSAEAQELAGALGLSFEAQALKAKGLAGFLEEVRIKTGGNTEVMAKLFGSVEALGAVLSLTGKQSKDFKDILAQMATSAGTTDTAFSKMADTPAFAAQKMKAAMADMQLALGQAVTALTPVVQTVTGAVNAFNNLPGPVKETTAAVAGIAIAATPVLLAVNAIQKAVGLASVAIIGLGAASSGVAVPAAAAAVSVGALGTASAVAAPAIGLAARAAGLLSTALGAFKLGLLPIALLAAEFFRVKQAAEDGDAAVSKMLEGPEKAKVVDTVGQAAVAVQEVGKATEKTTLGLEGQTAATLVAAKALGVDMAEASRGTSLEFQKNANDLDTLIDGMDRLKEKGFDAGQAVSQALSKMIDGAKSNAELDAIRGRIEGLGKAGKLAEPEVRGFLERATDKARDLRQKLEDARPGIDGLAEAARKAGVDVALFTGGITEQGKASVQVIGDLVDQVIATGVSAERASPALADALDKRLEAAQTEEEVEALKDQIDRAARAGKLFGTDLVDALGKVKAKAEELSPAMRQVAETNRVLGIRTQTELQAIADESKAAFDRAAASGKYSAQQLVVAFQNMRDDAIAANGGIEPSWIRQRQLMVESKAAAAGLSTEIVKGMDKGRKATVEATDAMGKFYDAMEKLRGFDGGVSGLGITGIKDSALEKRNAEFDNTPFQSGSSASSAKNAPGASTYQTGQAVNRPATGEWTYTLNPAEVEINGVDVNGKRLPGGWMQVVGERMLNGGAGSAFANRSAAAAAASAGAATPTGQRPGVLEPTAPLTPGATAITPSAPGMFRVEWNTKGVIHTTFTRTQADAEAWLRDMELSATTVGG